MTVYLHLTAFSADRLLSKAMTMICSAMSPTTLNCAASSAADTAFLARETVFVPRARHSYQAPLPEEATLLAAVTISAFRQRGNPIMSWQNCRLAATTPL